MPKTNTNKTKQQFNLSAQNWIAITGLVITTVVTLYLAFRGEIYQKRLPELQDQAKLVLRKQTTRPNEATYRDSFEIVNNGPAIAKNIRIVMCMRVSPIWLNSITDTSLIDLTVSNKAIRIMRENTKSNCNDYSGTLSNDAIELTIESLPSAGYVWFLPSISPDVLIDEYRSGFKAEYAIDKKLVLENGNLPFNDYLEDYISDHIEDVTSVVYFSIDVACDNCLVEKEIGNSSIKGITYLVIGPIVQKGESELFINAESRISLRYRIPQGVVPGNIDFFLSEPMYFVINKEGNGVSVGRTTK